MLALTKVGLQRPLLKMGLITGFGRTGAMFGSDKYGIEPDLIAVPKGLTSAYLGLLLVRMDRQRKGLQGARKGLRGPRRGGPQRRRLPHGSPTPGIRWARPAEAVLDIVERENLPNKANELGACFQAGSTRMF